MRNFELNSYKTFVFDCDGVLLNSNRVKSEAFFQCTIQYGEKAANDFLKYHIRNGGVSRYEKFKTFQLEILNMPFDPELHESLLRSYAQSIKDSLLICDVAPGLERLRAKYSSARWVVVSGGDQIELREVFALRGLHQFFDGGIFGSPDSKHTIISREVAEKNILSPAVFFGDSPYDYEAAKAAGFDFVFVSNWSENLTWRENNPQLKEIYSLDNLL